MYPSGYGRRSPNKPGSRPTSFVPWATDPDCSIALRAHGGCGAGDGRARSGRDDKWTPSGSWGMKSRGRGSSSKSMGPRQPDRPSDTQGSGRWNPAFSSDRSGARRWGQPRLGYGRGRRVAEFPVVPGDARPVSAAFGRTPPLVRSPAQEVVTAPLCRAPGDRDLGVGHQKDPIGDGLPPGSGRSTGAVRASLQFDLPARPGDLRHPGGPSKAAVHPTEELRRRSGAVDPGLEKGDQVGAPSTQILFLLRPRADRPQGQALTGPAGRTRPAVEERKQRTG